MKKNVILISGQMRSGKNQFATFLKQELINRKETVCEDAFASILKQWCKEDLLPIIEYLNSFVEDFFVEFGREDFPSDVFERIKKLQISTDDWYDKKTELTRLMLQIYGTNIFRNRVDNDFWVKKMAEKIWSCKEKYIIITDVRFPNEIDELKNSLMNSRKKELLGFVSGFKFHKIRINRNTDQEQYNVEHVSETAMDMYKNWDWVINNNGTLEDLKQWSIDVAKEITNANS